MSARHKGPHCPDDIVPQLQPGVDVPGSRFVCERSCCALRRRRTRLSNARATSPRARPVRCGRRGVLSEAAPNATAEEEMQAVRCHEWAGFWRDVDSQTEYAAHVIPPFRRIDAELKVQGALCEAASDQVSVAAAN